MEPLQPALVLDPEAFPNADLRPVAGPDRRTTGTICVDRTIRICLVMQALILPTSITLVVLGGIKSIPFYWLIVGGCGAVMSCSLIVGLLTWERKRRQDNILQRMNSARRRISSWGSEGRRTRRRRNRRPNPQENPVPVQDESRVEERRVGHPTAAQRTDDSQLPGTSVERNPGGRPETAAGRLARSMLHTKSPPVLARARHDTLLPRESVLTRQLQRSLDALPSMFARPVPHLPFRRSRRISGDVPRSDPQTLDVQRLPDRVPSWHGARPETPGVESELGLRQPVHSSGIQAWQWEGTSDTELPREDLQPSSASEPEGARHGQSMPTELTMIKPLQQAVDELATPPILSELARPVGIPLFRRSRRSDEERPMQQAVDELATPPTRSELAQPLVRRPRQVTGGGERTDLETLDVQQLQHQEQIPNIPGAVHELEGSEDPVQRPGLPLRGRPAQGPCPLVDWDDI